jgi:hypothetical protein
MNRASVTVVVALVFLLSPPPPAQVATDESSPAIGFVESIWRSAQIEETPCSTLPEKLHGAYRCGKIPNDVVSSFAHETAFALAGEGVPVLEFVNSATPRYQLVDLPGFEPFEQVPGFRVTAYLVGRHRIGVWINHDLVAFTVEELDGPFPEIFPAVDADHE